LSFGQIRWKKFEKIGHFWSFLATFKTKVTSRKRNKIGHLRVFWSNGHFYFIFSYSKKIKNYINIRKKVAN